MQMSTLTFGLHKVSNLWLCSVNVKKTWPKMTLKPTSTSPGQFVRLYNLTTFRKNAIYIEQKRFKAL